MTSVLVVSQCGPPGSVDDIIDRAPRVRFLNYRSSYVHAAVRLTLESDDTQFTYPGWHRRGRARRPAALPPARPAGHRLDRGGEPQPRLLRGAAAGRPARGRHGRTAP